MGSAAAVVERLYRAFANKDLDGVIGALDPAIRWREADGFPYAGIFHGPAAVKAGVFDRIIGEWSSYTTVPSEIIEQGNTVIVIEHNLEVIKTADYIFDLGPEGGTKGGHIVAQGTPEDVAKVKKSFTGQYLAPYLATKRTKKKAS